MISKLFKLHVTDKINEYLVSPLPELNLIPFLLLCRSKEEAEFILTQFNNGSLQIPTINSDCFENLSTFEDMGQSKYTLKDNYNLAVLDKRDGTVENIRKLSWDNALIQTKKYNGESKELALTIIQPSTSATATRRITDSDGTSHSLKFEWDENKSKLNKENHELDFYEVIDLFAESYFTTIQEENSTPGREQVTLIDKDNKVWRIVFVVNERSHNGYPEHFIRIITGHRHRR